MTNSPRHSQKSPLPQLHGVLVLDKPSGPTSARCLSALKRLGQKKIGHAGTLDPMASGVLLVLLGNATKIAGHLLADGGKVYSGTFRLGQTTDTWDKEGSVIAEAPWEQVTPEQVRDAVAAWQGVSDQLVPPYSAAKHQGMPLYKLARTGREAPQKVKRIEISHAEVLEMALPYVRFRVACSSGTYIRSLAHSLGIRLGCGAMLTELTREYSHPFGLDVAHTLDEILAEPEKLPERIMPISAALPGWKNLSISPAQEANLRNGIPVPHTPEFGEFQPGERALITAQGGSPLALAEARMDRQRPVWAVLRGLFTH